MKTVLIIILVLVGLTVGIVLLPAIIGIAAGVALCDYRNSCRRGVVQIRPLYMGADMHFLWDSCKHGALWRRIRVRKRRLIS